MPTACRTDAPAPVSQFRINPEDHLKWAKAIARGVGHDYRLQKGSQEELELEGTANLVLCEYAPRFDVRLAFVWAAAPLMARAARMTPIGAPPLPGPSVFRNRIIVCGTDVTEWVRRSAQQLARKRTVGHAACLEAAARAAAAVAKVFDPIGAFRGWCRVEVASRCKREAARLKNGGTFNTKRGGTHNFTFVKSLPRTRSANPDNDFGESRVWSDVMPKWDNGTGELNDAAGNVRLDQIRTRTRAAPSDRRPALHDEEEPWAPCDTTPDD